MIQLILSSKVSFWFTKGISRQEGGIGIFGFAVLAIFLDRFFGFCSKKRRFFDFGVHCGLRIFRLLAFVFFLEKNTNGFSDLISDVVFGFSN